MDPFIKLVKNHRGNSFAAVLIGAGIMGVVMVGMMDSVNVALKGQRTVDTRLATSEFENEVYSMLAIQNICTYNWGNDTIRADDISNVISVTELKTQDNTGTPVVRFTTNSTNNLNLYEQGRIRLLGMELRDFQAAGTVAIPSEDAMATLRLNLERVGSILGTKQVVRDISISIDLKDPYPTVANPFVEFCQAVGGMGDQIWTQKPNRDIYYNGGKVGIGTTNPSGILHINMPANEPPMFEFNGASNIGSSGMRLYTSRGTRVAPTALQAGDLMGSYGFFGYGTTGYGVGGRIVGRAAENHTDANHGMHIDFETVNVGGGVNQSRMRISSEGNIGLGTVAPKAPTTPHFLPNRSVDIDSQLYVGDSTGKIISIASATATASVPNVPTIYSWDNVGSNHTDFVLRASPGPQLYLQNCGGAGCSGNVGIGTTTPAVALDVSGGIRAGSAGVAAGGACTATGAMAYDATAQAPVYCKNTGVWTAMSGSASPPGTLCGMRVLYRENSGFLTYEYGGSPNVFCEGSSLTAVILPGNWSPNSVSGCPTGHVGRWSLTGGAPGMGTSQIFQLFCIKT